MTELNKVMRPKSFDEVFGQSHTKILLQNAIQQNRLARLILFSGPSGTGKSTLAEIVASQIATQGQVKKVNMGNVQGKSDILDIIKDIFILQAGTGNTVYILEEVHSLTKDQQIPFLEEIERQQEGVYIFMCTTQPERLIPELRGRATQHRLSRPSKEECVGLIEKACDYLGIKHPTKEVSKFLIRRVGPVPRELIKTVDTLSVSGDLGVDAVSRYLGAVTTEKFLDILVKAKMENVEEFYLTITDDEYQSTDLVFGLKEFFKDLTEYLFGSNKQIFSIKEKKILNTFLKGVRTEEILNMVHYVGRLKGDTETNAFYELMDFRRFLHEKSKVKEVVESRKDAVTAEIKSEEQTRKNEIVEQQSDEALSDDEIMDLLGELEIYSEEVDSNEQSKSE